MSGSNSSESAAAAATLAVVLLEGSFLFLLCDAQVYIAFGRLILLQTLKIDLTGSAKLASRHVLLARTLSTTACCCCFRTLAAARSAGAGPARPCCAPCVRVQKLSAAGVSHGWTCRSDF